MKTTSFVRSTFVIRLLVFLLALGVFASGATLAQQPVATSTANDPNADHTPGIYNYQDGKLTPMERVQPTTKATGGMKVAMMPGIGKADSRIVVGGTHATLQIAETPTFFFYFEKQSGFGNGMGAPTSTDQFKLLRWEVKKDSREAVIMQTNGFTSSAGISDKNAVAFSTEKLANGGVKVTANLPPGEYCFMNSGDMTVFNFSVVEKNTNKDTRSGTM